ncbi:MAG TPA: universal stress protein [Candidatus Methylomirabilis sp.]|nr:universal stress protein [Candidatus Methylomirabilis sp.]
MYQKILVPLDGSQLAEMVLPHAIAVAKATRAEVTLVTVVTHTTGGPEKAYVETLPEVVAERRAAATAEAVMYLERVQRGLKEQGVAAHCDSIEGDVADSILGYAEHKGFDLIAMATHGRSGLDRFLMGSIAEKVVRGSLKPVLLIRVPPAAPRPLDWPPENPSP